MKNPFTTLVGVMALLSQKIHGKKSIPTKGPETFQIKAKRWKTPAYKFTTYHVPPIIKLAFYGKAMYRRYKRAKAWVAVFSKPTSTTFRDSKGRGYRVWSDGSYRLMVQTGRKVVPV